MRVRHEDALDFFDLEGLAPNEPLVVVDDDEGKPDWRPDPVFDAEQADIDFVVDKILLGSSDI